LLRVGSEASKLGKQASDLSLGTEKKTSELGVVVTAVALAAPADDEPLRDESVVPKLTSTLAMGEAAYVEPDRAPSPTNTVNSSAWSEAGNRRSECAATEDNPHRRRRKKTTVPASEDGGVLASLKLRISELAEPLALAEAEPPPAEAAPPEEKKPRRRRSKVVKVGVEADDPYDPYAV